MPSKLTESFFVFCDFLGFSKMVCDAEASGDPEALSKLLDQLQSAINAGLGFFENDDPLFSLFERDKHFKLFSDNLAITLPLDAAFYGDEGHFGAISTNLAYYQLAIMEKGFFVRGGFTLGKVYMDQNIVYGVPVIDAVGIEKSTAVYPRIVLSDGLTELVQHHLTFYGNVRESPQQRYLLCDRSGEKTTVFVNYLGGLIDDEYDETVLNFPLLEKHRDLIMQNLEQHRDDQRVYAKYEWLGGYHNYFCQWMSRAGAVNYSDSLIVPGIEPLANLRQIYQALKPKKIVGLD